MSSNNERKPVGNITNMNKKNRKSSRGDLKMGRINSAVGPSAPNTKASSNFRQGQSVNNSGAFGIENKKFKSPSIID